MSAFSDLDASSNATALLAYLDDTDRGLSAIKAYMAVTAQLHAAGQPVLDLGCGVGHDLVRLARSGVRPVGLDSSAQALARAKVTGHAVVRGDGAKLPFVSDAFVGVRMERVLQHVADPDAVLDEVMRVVRPGGLLLVFEPDWTLLRVESEVVPDGSLPAQFAAARHPTIGTDAADLLRSRGCVIDDIVTEMSFGYTLEALPIHADVVTQRGVDAGALSAHLRRAWLEEQQQRDHAGTFRATWGKILTVARSSWS